MKKKFWKSFIWEWLLVGTVKDLFLLYVCLVLAYYLRILLFYLFDWTSAIG